MSTKREAIFQAIAAKLQLIPGVTVARNRETAATPEEGVVVVLYGRWNDVPSWSDGGYGQPIEWKLSFGVRVMAAGSVAIAAADTAVGLVHAAILTEPTQGGLCDTTMPVSHAANIADSGAGNAVFYDLSYDALYTTTALNLTA